MSKKVLIAAVLIAASSTTFAAGPGALYAGVDAGKTEYDNVPDSKTCVGAFAGYKFHPNFAAELGYRRLSDETVNGVDITVDQLALSIVGAYPVTDKFDVYGRLGYNHIDVKTSPSGFNAGNSFTGRFFGLGLGYALTPVVSARIEVQAPSVDSTNVSAGLVFKF
jgi:long-subunit fatty acid transport protein